jgi:hypothetical protein
LKAGRLETDREQRMDLQLKVPLEENEANEPPVGGLDEIKPKGLKANSPFLMANSSEISWSIL